MEAIQILKGYYGKAKAILQIDFIRDI